MYEGCYGLCIELNKDVRILQAVGITHNDDNYWNPEPVAFTNCD